MPSLPPVHIVAPTIVRYTFHQKRWGTVAMDCVMDVSIDGIGAIDRDDVVDDFNSHVCGFWQDTMLASYATVTEFAGAGWIDLNSLSGRTGVLGPAGGHATHGANIGQLIPHNTCFLIHKRTTAMRGQRMGRSFIGDPSEAQVDDGGSLTAGTITQETNRAEAFRTAIADYEHPLFLGGNPAALRVVHVHKADRLDPSTWTWSSSTVESMACDARVATQRRRLR